jgi:hypothetical protein
VAGIARRYREWVDIIESARRSKGRWKSGDDMDQQPEHDLSHRQERKQKKEEHKHPKPGRRLSSIHPAWYVVVAVISIGAAVLIWTFLPW